MGAPADVNLYVAADAGADQPLDHQEPRGPEPTAALIIRAISTSSAAAFTAIQNIRASIAFSPLLFWQAPHYPAPGRDYVEWPGLLSAQSS
jgi:hypothetical protein